MKNISTKIINEIMNILSFLKIIKLLISLTFQYSMQIKLYQRPFVYFMTSHIMEPETDTERVLHLEMTAQRDLVIICILFPPLTAGDRAGHLYTTIRTPSATPDTLRRRIIISTNQLSQDSREIT